jgi:lipoate-protein ligase A
MALDEWLMLTAAQRPPTLRVYGWRRPTVSLGRNERWRGVLDFGMLARHGVRLVRRPTGGRAVLHHREFTYSVTASPATHPEVGMSLDDTLVKVSEALAFGLRDLGIHGEAVRRDQALPRQAGVCFESSARYEFVAGGQKVVGNAQYRTPSEFLQHGSMPLYPTLPSLHALGGRDADGRDGGQAASAHLASRSLDRVGAIMCEAFARRFGSPVAWQTGSVIDTNAVRRLVAFRYGRADWTYRR